MLTDVEKICTKINQESQTKIILQTENQIQQIRIETSGMTRRLDQNIKEIKKGVKQQFAQADATQQTTLTKIFDNQDKMMAMLISMKAGTPDTPNPIQGTSPESASVQSTQQTQMYCPSGTPMDEDMYRKRSLLESPPCKENAEGTSFN
jgi:vacuolar-type H+-ATPase catalytic subunit A/Vma1